MPARTRIGDGIELGVLLVDAVLLAVLELLYLPVYLGAVPFPVTALLAALTLPLLVRRAASVYAGTIAAASPAVLWLLTLFVVGLAGPGGDMVLVPDWRTLVLIAGGLLPSAIVLGSATGRNARNQRSRSSHG